MLRASIELLSAVFLAPLSLLYSAVTTLRNIFYDYGFFQSYKSKLPVISIGNISVGGNAKTPLIIEIALELKKRGCRPALLTRGYKGSLNGPILVSSAHTVKEVGDEALLLWHNTQLPVCVAKSRVAGVKLIQEQHIADLVLLDDGLQHRALGRRLDIISAYIGSEKAKQDFIRARLLPWGRFRESRAQALKRAKIVILSHRKLLQAVPIMDQEISKLLPIHCQIFQSYMKDPALKLLQSTPDSQSLKAGCEIVLLSAIAEPQGIIDSLESLGLKIKQVVSFMDHHLFSVSELERVGKLGYPVVCSTKDSVKIPADLYTKFLSGLFVLEVRTEITNREDFFNLIYNLN